MLSFNVSSNRCDASNKKPGELSAGAGILASLPAGFLGRVIAQYLDYAGLARLSATCTEMRSAKHSPVPLVYQTKTMNVDAPGPYQGDGLALLWNLDKMPFLVDHIVISLDDYYDQGWGNRKGHLFIEIERDIVNDQGQMSETKDLETTSVAPCMQRRFPFFLSFLFSFFSQQKKQEKKERETKETNKGKQVVYYRTYAPYHLAPHESGNPLGNGKQIRIPMECFRKGDYFLRNFNINDRLQVMYLPGGGGGHHLTIQNLILRLVSRNGPALALNDGFVRCAFMTSPDGMTLTNEKFHPRGTTSQGNVYGPDQFGFRLHDDVTQMSRTYIHVHDTATGEFSLTNVAHCIEPSRYFLRIGAEMELTFGCEPSMFQMIPIGERPIDAVVPPDEYLAKFWFRIKVKNTRYFLCRRRMGSVFILSTCDLNDQIDESALTFGFTVLSMH